MLYLSLPIHSRVLRVHARPELAAKTVDLAPFHGQIERRRSIVTDDQFEFGSEESVVGGGIE